MKNLHSRIKLIRPLASTCLALACFGLSPQARAVCQEGCLGVQNTVLGEDALLNNTSFYNTAIGFQVLLNNTTGSSNTANGDEALYSNTTGSWNTATGSLALFNNTTGSNNTANGLVALYLNTTGSKNTADGYQALYNNATGNNNTADGHQALLNNFTGSNNIALGFKAGSLLTTGNNNIYIGNPGLAAGESRTIRIGNDRNHSKIFIVGIRDVTTGNADAIPVLIDSAGQLGTLSSARRFKNDIKPMEQSSEAILGLKPVTFHYKSDAKSTPQFGLIAEDVEKVNSALVARDEQGKPYTVRYEAVNAMLLNEFLKEHRKVEALEATVAAQQKGFESQIAALTAAVKTQAAQIRKVSDQLKTQAPAPRVVAND